jgi:hypothetical protein
MEAPPQAVLAELQQVLEQACASLQLQEEGRLQEAAQGYFLARSRVHYVAEALLAPLAEAALGDADVAVAATCCRMLQETYSLALERCNRGGFIGFDGSAADSEEAEGTQQLRCADAGLADARRTSGAGGGGREHGQGQQRPGVAQRCMREVEGSLDEVVGLAVIKQVRAPLPLAQHPHGCMHGSLQCCCWCCIHITRSAQLLHINSQSSSHSPTPACSANLPPCHAACAGAS